MLEYQRLSVFKLKKIYTYLLTNLIRRKLKQQFEKIKQLQIMNEHSRSKQYNTESRLVLHGLTTIANIIF